MSLTNKAGDVFSLKDYGDPNQTDKKIGTFEEQANGDIRVTLDMLPWGGGKMLMRPTARLIDTTIDRRDPS